MFTISKYNGGTFIGIDFDMPGQKYIFATEVNAYVYMHNACYQY